MKNWWKDFGWLVIAALVFVMAFFGLAWLLGRVVESGVKGIDDRGGLKSVAERIWYGKKDAPAQGPHHD